MSLLCNESFESEQIKLIRRYLKCKLIDDNVTFRGHEREREHIYDLMKRTVSCGESHSALMIGPRGCGKTTLINSVVDQLKKEVDLTNDALMVKLDGLLHHDEKLALKAITAQMQLENAVGDRVFGTFAENLNFLLNCLQSGSDRRCKSMLFILEEFDMFCHCGRTQTLLYNLFDITHAKQSPMCVIGITNRIDVMELLEKRVKSRFSHRHIFLFPNEAIEGCIAKSPVDKYRDLLVDLLSMPVREQKRKKGSRKSMATPSNEDIPFCLPDTILKKCNIDPQIHQNLDPSFMQDWNAHIQSLSVNETVVDAVEKLCYYTVNEQVFRDILFQIVSRISPRQPFIAPSTVLSTIDLAVSTNQRVLTVQSLSILELSLLIAMMHGMEVFDGQPMNFEMVLHRYTKFANSNSSTQTVPRPVILKAFEHLQQLEIIMSVRPDNCTETTASRVQKEFKLYTLAVPVEEIREAVKNFKALPTEINHWFNNSIVD